MSFFRILFILFLTIPLLEIYLFIQVGEVIGGFATIFLIIATAVLGVWLLRWQGLITFNKLQMTMSRGELPAVPLVEGMMLLVAGALLLSPGFFTDAIGFIFLVPPLRQQMAQWFLLKGMFQAGRGFGPGFQHSAQSNERKTSTRHESHIIEGDYERRDDD